MIFYHSWKKRMKLHRQKFGAKNNTVYEKNEHTNSINHEMHHRIYAVAWLFMIIDQTFHAMIMVIIYEILVFMDNIFHTYSVHDPYSKSIQSMFCTYRGKILARWSAWKIADAPARFPNYDFYHKMSQNKRNWSIVSFSINPFLIVTYNQNSGRTQNHHDIWLF